MSLKTYDEMNPEQQMAYRMGYAQAQDDTVPKVTVADLVEVAESMGGKATEAYDVFEETVVIYVENPGRYLVMPIPEEGQ